MTFIKTEHKDTRQLIPYEISHLKHKFDQTELERRCVASQTTLARLRVITEFMHKIGFTVANGEVWRGFTRGKEHISFYLAKQIVAFAARDGHHVYRFCRKEEERPGYLILNKSCYTGREEKDIVVPRNEWNKAVVERIGSGIHYGFDRLQIDKKCRCVFDETGMVQYAAK